MEKGVSTSFWQAYIYLLAIFPFTASLAVLTEIQIFSAYASVYNKNIFDILAANQTTNSGGFSEEISIQN